MAASTHSTPSAGDRTLDVCVSVYEGALTLVLMHAGAEREGVAEWLRAQGVEVLTAVPAPELSFVSETCPHTHERTGMGSYSMLYLKQYSEAEMADNLGDASMGARFHSGYSLRTFLTEFNSRLAPRARECVGSCADTLIAFGALDEADVDTIRTGR